MPNVQNFLNFWNTHAFIMNAGLAPQGHIYHRLNTNTEHHLYDLENQTFGWDHLLGKVYQPTTVTRDPNGNTCFLPYGNGTIHSFIVPANRRPAVPGHLPGTPIKILLTANVSGCTIYIDLLTNGSLVFYHANSIVQPPPNPNDPTSLAPATQAEMTSMLAAARTDHGILAHQIQNSFALEKTTYYQALLTEIQRKQGHGRIVAANQAVGGCSVVGLWRGGRWEFYYQIIGGLVYARPRKAPKGWVMGVDVDRTAVAQWKVLQPPHLFFHS